ncbi:alpha/beta hydrolase fold domain-containing protein [Gordonia sp. zg691]|nr:alpha/beta hydrolase fold domain-containing protein [Gordonia jinghuaiqii]
MAAGARQSRAYSSRSRCAPAGPWLAGPGCALSNEDGVVGEWVSAGVTASNRVVLYLHGSAYAICSARSHRGLASRLSRETGLPAFVVDYRLAPEFPFPTAADDVERAYRWLLSQGFRPDDITVAGDSAGGHLALDLVLDNARRAIPQPGAVVLFSPLIDLTYTLASTREQLRPDPMHVFQALPRISPEADRALRRAAELLDRVPTR